MKHKRHKKKSKPFKMSPEMQTKLEDLKNKIEVLKLQGRDTKELENIHLKYSSAYQ